VRKAAYERRYNQTVRPAPERFCACGISIPKKDRQCADCRAAARRRRKERDKRRRRALKRGARSESYTLAEIAVRDGHLCGLCHAQVPMDLAVPHPQAPTVDHVVPLAKGGDDTRANVQLAHFICNSLKGDRDVQQLALVG
jgi:5-methylcytosine-specific restriction endonuclease McrA